MVTHSHSPHTHTPVPPLSRAARAHGQAHSPVLFMHTSITVMPPRQQTLMHMRPARHARRSSLRCGPSRAAPRPRAATLSAAHHVHESTPHGLSYASLIITRRRHTTSPRTGMHAHAPSTRPPSLPLSNRCQHLLVEGGSAVATYRSPRLLAAAPTPRRLSRGAHSSPLTPPISCRRSAPHARLLQTHADGALRMQRRPRRVRTEGRDAITKGLIRLDEDWRAGRHEAITCGAAPLPLASRRMRPRRASQP